MTRSVCIHGHFYQPPRENPWLDEIETQDGAYPYHDWNERITDECYAPNAASRVLDDEGRIAHITNNYARLSFNVGPTLLAWMARHAPDVHDAIVAADRESAERFGGHGSALAQAYGHVIMPLASPRDRRTQVRWGVADFRHRFGRDPEGMWLPETAVDTDSLEALAEEGIAFTILEPSQAAAVRPLGESAWTDVGGGAVDTTMPYLVRLPSGAEIAVFFYDGAISRAVAFEGLLADGAVFARRLAAASVPDRDGVLVNIATDGESYGHHHRHGDMALAFALHELASDPEVELTNYGAFLERHPPTHEARIAEQTSWSCAHGVERWRADCGCSDGGHPEWSQDWRAPLRAALDWLRDEIDARFEDRSRGLLADPWKARDAYITVLLDSEPQAREALLATHAAADIGRDGRVSVWRLLELQRHAMLMYTSCGWFFDDLARIETVQVLRYAARAIELAHDVTGDDLEDRFLDRLAAARSNIAARGDGRQVYEELVRPAIATLEDVAGDVAVTSLFDPESFDGRVYCYDVRRSRVRVDEAGPARLAVGRLEVRALFTEEATTVDYGVLHLGDHNLEAGIRQPVSDEEFEAMAARLRDAFLVADLPATLRLLEEAFARRITLNSLFRDEQRRVLDTILDTSIAEARAAFHQLYHHRAALMRYLTEIGASIPHPFLSAAEVAVDDELRKAFTGEQIDPDRVRSLLEDADSWGLELDTAGLARVLSGTVERLTDQAASVLPLPRLFEQFGPAEQAFFDRARTLIELGRDLPFEVDLWRAQNVYFEALRSALPELDDRAASGDETARTWTEQIRALGVALGFAPDAAPLET